MTRERPWQAMNPRDRRTFLRAHTAPPRNRQLEAVIAAAMDLAFAFYDQDAERGQRLTDYAAAFVAGDIQTKYRLLLREWVPDDAAVLKDWTGPAEDAAVGLP